jgi:cytochrome b561
MLHWALALLVLTMLAIGFFWLRPMSSADPHKITLLLVHLLLGTLAVGLPFLRLAVRVRTGRSGDDVALPVVGRWAKLVHRTFYILIILMGLTGYATVASAGLFLTLFGRSDAPVPGRFTVFPTFIVHTLVAELLVVLIVLHLGAALYHLLVKRDEVLRRMSLSIH